MSSYLKIEYAVRWLPVSSERSDAKLSKAQKSSDIPDQVTSLREAIRLMTGKEASHKLQQSRELLHVRKVLLCLDSTHDFHPFYSNAHDLFFLG